MRIILLGSGGYHPNAHRHTACLMIPEAGVLLDAGTAAFRVAEHLVTDRLDVFLSHAHLDHVFGLTGFLGLFDGFEQDRITVHAEPQRIDAVRQHLFAPLLFPVDPPFTFVPLAPVTPLTGGGRLTYIPVEHPGGAVAFRLEWPGHSLAYVTDTIASPDAPYVEHIAGVDLLIHEAYFDDGRHKLARLTGHSCVSDVADVAAAAGVNRLVLCHMNPREDREEPLDLTAAKQRFANLQVGRDLMAIEF